MSSSLGPTGQPSAPSGGRALPEPAGDAGPGICAACGAPGALSFCAACGQRVLTRRHTLPGLATGAFQRLFSVEQGLTHTALRLTVDPGGVVRDYLGGRTVVYVHPVAYLAIAFALFAVTARWLGGTGSGDDRVFWGAIVLFLAVASRIVFRRTGLNFAEHLVLNLFLFSHAVVLLTGGLILTYVLPRPAQPSMTVLALVGACLYVLWSYTRVFPGRPALRLLGGLAVLVSGTVMWGVVLAVVVRFARDG